MLLFFTRPIVLACTILLFVSNIALSQSEAVKANGDKKIFPISNAQVQTASKGLPASDNFIQTDLLLKTAVLENKPHLADDILAKDFSGVEKDKALAARFMAVLRTALDYNRMWFLDKMAAARISFAIEDEAGETPLHYSIFKSESDDVFFFMIKQNVQVNHADSDGQTTLHLAAMKNSEPIINCLLKNGANLEAPDKSGVTPLLASAWSCQMTAFKTLLTSGANIHARDNAGNTCLHYAFRDKYPDRRQIASQAILQKVDANLRNNAGQTPLHLAVNQDIIEGIRLLLNHDADANLADNKGKSPLFYATSTVAIDLLASHGADINHKDNQGKTIVFNYLEPYDKNLVENYVRLGGNIDAQDTTGETPLFIAARNSYRPENLLHLLSLGAAVNIQNANGQTPLHQSPAHNIINILIEHGADPRIADKDGDTPLHLLHPNYQKKYREIVDLFIAKGVDVNAKNNYSMTPLHFAASFMGSTEMIDILIEKGAKIAEKDDSDRTFLYYGSAFFKLPEFMKYQAMGMDIFFTDKTGRNLLFPAVSNHELTEYLIRQELPVLKDSQGLTPLHLAAIAGNPKTIEFYINECQKVFGTSKLLDHQGRSPLHLAAITNRAHWILMLAAVDKSWAGPDHSGKTPLHYLVRLKPDESNLQVYDKSNVLRKMFRYRKPAGDDYDHYLQSLDMAARETAGALADTGIAIDSKDNAGRTPLYYIIQNKMWSTAHFLIKKGANPHEKGPDGISPAMLIDAADSHYLKQVLGIAE